MVCRVLLFLSASILWLPAYAEEPVPPLSPQARILWDALIEVPPRVLTSGVNGGEGSYAGDRVWEEFLRHPQVRERLAEGLALSTTRADRQRAQFLEVIERFRTLTGLPFTGAEQIRADYRREFQSPQPLSPRERRLRAERMARAEFERRYPGRAADESPEYRLEYARLLNRFEIQLEDEQTRRSSRPSRSRVTAWARRWVARIQQEQERFRREGIPRLLAESPELLPRVVAVPVTADLERFKRSRCSSRWEDGFLRFRSGQRSRPWASLPCANRTRL